MFFELLGASPPDPHRGSVPESRWGTWTSVPQTSSTLPQPLTPPSSFRLIPTLIIDVIFRFSLFSLFSILSSSDFVNQFIVRLDHI